MFDFASPLFWYRLQFLAELLVAEAFFAFKLKRRSRFPLRVALAVLVCFAVTFLFPIAAYNAFYISFMFIFIFALTMAGLYVCFREPLINILFVSVAAYAMQHVAYELYTLLSAAFGLQSASSLQYAETGELAFDVWTVSVYIESYAAVYALMYAAFGTRIKRGTDLRIGNARLLVISGVILLAAVLLNAVVAYRAAEDTDVVLLCIIHGSNALCCVLAVFIQFFMLAGRKMQSELDTLRLLHEQEQRHYMRFKENVDYINVKCHDLKHQIRRIASAGAVNDSVIGEIERAVTIYDSDVKTGNETLDIVLTEKRLTCADGGIAFSCIADGAKLGFMTDADICSLFGNALDNAIEAACRIEDRSRRSIGLTVKESKGFVSVCVRNSCPPDVRVSGGLPATTKGDTVNHGYGMKSMKAVAERYGGELTAAAEDGVFTLNVIFPSENS